MKNKIEYFPQEKVKDILITRTAIKTLTSENIVEKIVSFQFKDIYQATKRDTSIEISGFGRLFISIPRAKKKLASLLLTEERMHRLAKDPSYPEEKLKALLSKIENIKKDIAYLKEKLNETQPEGDIGRNLE